MQNHRSQARVRFCVSASATFMTLAACARSVAPPSTLAPAHVAAAEAPPLRMTPIELRVTFWDHRPRRVELVVTGPGGTETQRSSCHAAPPRRIACDGSSSWYRGPGQYRVGLEYIAVDGVSERVETDLQIQGDEMHLAVAGSFDSDASLTGLRTRVVRAPPAGVTLVEVAPSEGGEPPRLVLQNASDMAFEVMSQGVVLSGLARIEEDGTSSPVVRGFGCGTGVHTVTLAPGDLRVVGEIAPIGGRAGLAPGRYRVTVSLFAPGNDTDGFPSDSSSWVVSHDFEVAPYDIAPESMEEQPWVELYDEPTDELPPEPDPPRLPRPAEMPPPGLAGAALDAATPVTLIDGSYIAGRVGPTRTGHAYRLDLPAGASVTVDAYARCTESPCAAQFSVHFGTPGDLGGSSGPLHRAPPAWSTEDRGFRTYSAGEHILEVSCLPRCEAGGAEFYGRVHVEAPAP